ncbi:MAG: C25 family cysteine peptidase, partial [candidate division WOR-3 bacterium]|nr:C25 family cysteine peptidase [candidate division WOR-3 bacterium]MDW7988303.1 C25 family cysteine peptidase [candidate division WOR-3 bacterium]
MKKFLLILLFITIIELNATTYTLQEVPISVFTEIHCETKTPHSLKITTRLPDERSITEVLLSRVISEFTESQSALLYYSKLLAIPDYADLQVRILNVDSIVVDLNEKNIAPLYISSKIDLPIVYLGKKGIIRDLNVVPVNIRQYRYLPEQNLLVCYINIEFEIVANRSFDNLMDANVVTKTWSEIYKNTIINYEEPTSVSSLPSSYIIIVADDLYNAILPLARWKAQKGFKVTIKRISEIGSSSTAIKNYLSQVYNTQYPKIEYVLLVGSSSAIPAIPAGQSVGDHLYACLDGDDLYPDVFLGRLPASDASTLSIMVNKIIGYERNPYIADTLWYRRALMVATSYQQSGVPVWTALATKRYIRELLLNNNFLRVDTCFYPPTASGVGVIDTIINRGVAFVNGRGWGNREGWTYPYFKVNEVYGLNNGWKLPIVTSFYCATGNYTASTNFGTAWLAAGTPINPKGAVAFYGPVYATTSTRFNNCQDFSIYWGIFEQDVHRCGPAMFLGKVALLENFPLPSDSLMLVTHVITYNLLGDPSLEMYTGQVPKELIVSYPSQLPVGSSRLTITVYNNLSQPVSGALVSLYKENEVQVSGYTNENGTVTLNFSAQTQDTLFVTVTKHNFIPHQGYIIITTPSININYYTHSGTLNAGSSNNLLISLKNYGSSLTATNTYAILRCRNSFVTVTDSQRSYGSISPGQVVTSAPFQVYVNANAPHNYRVGFEIAIFSDQYQGIAEFNTSVTSAELVYKKHIINDNGNNILEPNESAQLTVKIYNRGARNLNNVVARLRSANPYAIIVSDSIGYYGTINVGDTVENTQETFTIFAAPNIAIGRQFYLKLTLFTTGFEQTIEFPIVIGMITTTAPTGPDYYGYWAYDNTDLQYSEAPVYNWIEIDPNYGGPGTRLNIPHYGIRTLNLPFTFRYYGRNYNRISVTALGYIAMDSTSIVDPYNWQIPAPVGPPSIIATFWDDFHPETLSSSGVYYYYDQVNHRFIVQWSRIHHIHGFRNPYLAEQQTFQVILCNPQYHQTVTGDGPIIFQYHTVFNDDSAAIDCHNYATVGIESPTHWTGIEYTFANYYPPSAALIQSGRAIKFTTNPPDTFTTIINEPRSQSIL